MSGQRFEVKPRFVLGDLTWSTDDELFAIDASEFRRELVAGNKIRVILGGNREQRRKIKRRGQ